VSSRAEPPQSSLSLQPSLQIEELAITNFRTFRERTVIPFHDGAGHVDSIATLHGENGAGKSNAIAASDLFFYVAPICLGAGGDACDVLALWDMPFLTNSGALTIFYRDRPVGAGDAAADIVMRFADPRLRSMRLRMIPAGNQVRVQLEQQVDGAGDDSFAPVPRPLRDQLRTRLEAPSGPGSRPIAIVDSRRRALWLKDVNRNYLVHPSLLNPMLAEELFAARTSLRPEIRERWRQFVRMLQLFEPFKGKDISIDRISAYNAPELTVEDRGTVVLGLDELSSGEQQILVLCAAVMLARAGIFVVMEPELSLDAKNQRLLRGVFELAIDMGWVEQIIVESHVPSFDGPDVIRFRRGDDGATVVTREPSATEAQRELARRAKERGADQRWVTSEGYTQLPEIMLDDLNLRRGGHLWFLRGQSRWEAWPEGELTTLFADNESEERGE
jgi:hypothetical protein